MASMPSFLARSLALSTSILTTFTPVFSAANFANHPSWSILLHGPHHDAVNSATTEPDFQTSADSTHSIDMAAMTSRALTERAPTFKQRSDEIMLEPNWLE